MLLSAVWTYRERKSWSSNCGAHCMAVFLKRVADVASITGESSASTFSCWCTLLRILATILDGPRLSFSHERIPRYGYVRIIALPIRLKGPAKSTTVQEDAT